MRNGLDISNVSEFAHEISRKPVEAIIDFNASAVLARAGADVTIRPAHHGTQRMARSFHIPFTEDSADPFAGLSSYEGAVAALGACVLITHVHGYSARAITITSLRVVVSAAVEVDADGRWVGGDRALHDIRYEVSADCEGPEAGVREVSQFVCSFSPNHRAFIDEGTYEVSGLAVRSDDSLRVLPIDTSAPTAPATSGDRLDLTAELTWEYGTEATLTTTSSRAARRRRRPTLTVDQSKQMLGIDRGPNPQELLLAAISADLCQEVGRLATARGVPLANVEVESTGRLDIRGMLNTSPDIPARFHDLRFLVRADTDAEGEVFAELIRESAARNVVLATLRSPGVIDVEVRTPNGPLSGFRSDAATVAEFLAELKKRQAAQNARTSLSAQR